MNGPNDLCIVIEHDGEYHRPLIHGEENMNYLDIPFSEIDEYAKRNHVHVFDVAGHLFETLHNIQPTLVNNSTDGKLKFVSECVDVESIDVDKLTTGVHITVSDNVTTEMMRYIQGYLVVVMGIESTLCGPIDAPVLTRGVLAVPSTDRVKLLNPDSVDNVVNTYVAARTCYSPDGPFKLHAELSESMDIDKYLEVTNSIDKLLVQCFESGHTSVLEHMTFNFAIQCSRNCSHQIVRHRISAISQASQRYIGMERLALRIPPSFDDYTTLEYLVDNNKLMYRYLERVERGVPGEDARYGLPHGADTMVVQSFNMRSLLNFFGLRMCKMAQWEIREIAREMHKALKIPLGNFPMFYSKLGPKCVQLGYCTESKKKWCGYRPHLSEVYAKDTPKHEIIDAFGITEYDLKNYDVED